MKQFINIFFALLTAIACMGCCTSDARQSILKVYNWADYIDEELLSEFEEWYE